MKTDILLQEAVRRTILMLTAMHAALRGTVPRQASLTPSLPPLRTVILRTMPAAWVSFSGRPLRSQLAIALTTHRCSKQPASLCLLLENPRFLRLSEAEALWNSSQLQAKSWSKNPQLFNVKEVNLKIPGLTLLKKHRKNVKKNL